MLAIHFQQHHIPIYFPAANSRGRETINIRMYFLGHSVCLKKKKPEHQDTEPIIFLFPLLVANSFYFWKQRFILSTNCETNEKSYTDFWD
jgi:hypothetical protein